MTVVFPGLSCDMILVVASIGSDAKPNISYPMVM